MPTPSLLDNVVSIIPSGAYFEVDNLLKEIGQSKISENRLYIDPFAVVITKKEIMTENLLKLKEKIGSTGSGTGVAIINRIQRNNNIAFAKDYKCLNKYIKDTKSYLKDSLDRGCHLLIEGTQGFGLSLLHSEMYPFVTSRDTTAAGFLSEVGLSPFDVTDIIMTIRAFPIRVAGNSGILKNEIDWDIITKESGSTSPIIEYTSVSNNIRRVARFNKDIVKRAILVNKPSIIVLNHLDYLDRNYYNKDNISSEMEKYINYIEESINCKINYMGLDPFKYIER